MDDFKIIIYILAAVAYFLLTQWRKAFKGGDEEEVEVDRERRTPRQHPARPVTSFEDMLRELQPKVEQAKQQGQEVVQQAKERVRDLSPSAPTLAPETEFPRKYKNYEDNAPRILSWEKRAEAIEAAKQSKLSRKEPFLAYEQQHAPKVNRYAEMLHNPVTARDAVILSEIFNRKYS
ncbi:hypothetical protein [Pontibacter anaerobius]|uniref:Uncharacterized protein n=1 Tax=Pontibacter anaerobius TaxID=2993940 RepID=A0ABT3RD84_9BACT|nr:hypothetical protein [Pontibacter anaerobius]MCX2739240.1 hypothetical protein [Pontibacter anaerobius]